MVVTEAADWAAWAGWAMEVVDSVGWAGWAEVVEAAAAVEGMGEEEAGLEEVEEQLVKPRTGT